ncbi:MAG: RagB/SusD family nutrient uptake outer membrane protein [Gemmatimonadota bacterium]|nr:MAG: RagB/SusD family nutrient uptake outer membrane protein [Gemmatimonadota bacterium]
MTLCIASALLLAATSCDITTEPESTVTDVNIFDDASSYKAFLAKLYGGLVLTGQQGPHGQPDFGRLDEGFTQYTRQLWQLQELPTEEAVISWGDTGLPEMQMHTWGTSNQFIQMIYSRIFYQVSLVNEFLRETTDEKLAARGHTGLSDEIQRYRAEARFLRALSYWHGIDLFGNIPLVTEEHPLGAFPEQNTRAELFDFAVGELNEIRDDLPEVGAAQYGRADQGALAMLLAKLYMNAEVYVGADHYADAFAQIGNVIGGPYSLSADYLSNFLADNHTSPEIIFPVPQDGEKTRTWGNTTFLAHAACGGSMNANDYGLNWNWSGLRVRPEFVALFPGAPDSPDGRELFYTDGQNLEVNSIGTFTDGYAAPKYRNIDSFGQVGSDWEFPDTDYPMFRLADAYLMYAEIHLRGGGGTRAEALDYVNQLRERAYGDPSGNITDPELTLDFILDERARELWWEGHRRTDLIRYGLFSGDAYVWSWKGGVQAGTSTELYRDLYPIPASEMLANPNLEQNPGY